MIDELSTFASKKEFLKKLQMVISDLEDIEEDSVGSNQNFTHLNEDDSYDIDNIKTLH